MQSLVLKRSIVLNGNKTSVTLEDVFWSGLKNIAAERQQTMSEALHVIDKDKLSANLSSALRIYVFEHYRQKSLGL
jgi:predicted DNA-binding ribbon-helix-helix protein